MPTPNDDRLLRMDGWPGGVNNRVRETEQVSNRDGDAIPNSAFLRKALNVDLTAEGHPLRRRGYALTEAGYAHSVWYSGRNFFVVIDGSLKVGPKASELTTIATVNKYLRMSYTVHADEVYYSNGVDSGRWTGSALAVWPGTDQEYALFDDEDLDLTDNLYETMLIGQHIASHSGRIWAADRDVLWFSEGMSTHICRRATNYFMLPSQVAMLQPVEDGLYIGTATGVSFLRGTDPFSAEMDDAYQHGIVPYAFTRMPGEKFETREDVPVFWTKDGVLSVGLPGGEIKQLTRDRLAAPEYGFGAVSLREREGISQVVSSLQKGGDANNMGATDTVVAEIRQC